MRRDEMRRDRMRNEYECKPGYKMGWDDRKMLGNEMIRHNEKSCRDHVQ